MKRLKSYNKFYRRYEIDLWGRAGFQRTNKTVRFLRKIQKEKKIFSINPGRSFIVTTKKKPSKSKFSYSSYFKLIQTVPTICVSNAVNSIPFATNRNRILNTRVDKKSFLFYNRLNSLLIKRKQVQNLMATMKRKNMAYNYVSDGSKVHILKSLADVFFGRYIISKKKTYVKKQRKLELYKKVDKNKKN